MISNRIHRNFIILSNIHSLLKCFLWSEVFLLRNNLFKWESKQDLFIVFRNYVTTFFLIYNSLYLHLPLPLSFISLRNTYILTVECCIFWIWPIVSFWCSLTCSSFPAISFIHREVYIYMAARQKCTCAHTHTHKHTILSFC